MATSHNQGSDRPESGEDRASGIARERCILALDVDSLDEALALAGALEPWFGVVKVGLQLFTSVGPDAIRVLRAQGFEVFADLKLHDIPNTVHHAARAAATAGARWVTSHASGGERMLEAAVEGFAEGRSRQAISAAPAHREEMPGATEHRMLEPGILAVSVLTSEALGDPGVLISRVQSARAAHCAGIICAADDLGMLRALAGPLLCVVPGIRGPGARRDDQERVATATSAFAAGADLIVVGRAVTAAQSPPEAAFQLLGDPVQE